MTDDRRPRRPGSLSPAALEALGESTDPIAELHVAHETAAVLLHAGRAADDPAVTDRLVALVEEIGLDTLADLWSARPARTLPGALWRLYVLHEWVLTDPYGAAHEYAAGIRFTEPDHVVAGAGDPTGPDEVRQVTDQILRGVFTGDFAVALDRAAAFCRVVSSGRADVSEGAPAAVQAARLQTMAEDLTACARLWRAHALD